MTALQLANLKPITTSERARELGSKGGKAKAAKPKPLLITPLNHDSERLRLLAEQIALTRDVLNGKSVEHKDRAALLRALTGLLEQERIWSGRPLPGTLKPRQPDAKQAPALPQPVVEKPIQVQVQEPQPTQVVDVTTKAIET